MKQSEFWKRGLPYVGNKGMKAEKIIEALPAGHRFIDVFGGGGSISLTAASSGKWDEIIYNDRREAVVKLLKALIEDNPHIDLKKYICITRKEFIHWRDEMPDSIEKTLILLCWSFGNNMKDYLWSQKIEDNRHKLVAKYINTNSNKSIQKQYKDFKKAIRNNDIKRLQSIERLQQLERIQNNNTKLNIEFKISDYKDLNIKENDVVYCDPPYINTGFDYGEFNNNEFYQWLNQLSTNEIYISEYKALPHSSLYLNLGAKKNSFSPVCKHRNELLLKYQIRESAYAEIFKR